MAFEKDNSKVENSVKGTKGEIMAVNFLKKQGYKILKTNYKNRVGEIDIIAKDGKTYVFVEVKRRLTLAYGRPIEAVDTFKQNKIKKVAEMFLSYIHDDFADVRFDVVEIVDEEISLTKNAFQ